MVDPHTYSHRHMCNVFTVIATQMFWGELRGSWVDARRFGWLGELRSDEDGSRTSR